ncbi:hypothetical protein TNCV_2608031 [Trichonephila clavipes]|uniref:Uncharacterized protein n=1 Tax=Trichonephila clavipes TaxID=2585209 RepID=A0A8X6RZ85_TRICX|nr:hypothetical protein TNCV_2608031 [Trichonephila clavipes]
MLPSGYGGQQCSSDDGLPICVSEDQEIVDLSESMNSNSNAEIDNETSIVTFFNALENCESIPLSYTTGCSIFSSALGRKRNSFESGIKKIVKHLLVSNLKFPINW